MLIVLTAIKGSKGMNTQVHTPDWYNYRSIAHALSVSINTVRSWQQKKQMPQPDVQQHKFTRWKAETIEPFIKDPIQWREENLESEENQEAK